MQLFLTLHRGANRDTVIRPNEGLLPVGEAEKVTRPRCHVDALLFGLIAALIGLCWC